MKKLTEGCFPKPSCKEYYNSYKNPKKLPEEYKFDGPSKALDEIKACFKNHTCRFSSWALAEKRPCPGSGTHYGVKYEQKVKGGKEKYVASIVCCPTCEDTEKGPKFGQKCGILYKVHQTNQVIKSMVCLKSLQMLREAAKRRKDIRSHPDWHRSRQAWTQLNNDWEQCRLASEQILRAIGPKASILICLEMLEEFLPLFEKMTMNFAARRVLMRIRRKVNDESFSIRMHWFRSSPRPGANSFTMAIEDLLLAIECVKDNSPSWTEYCVDAIAGLIIAWCSYKWGTAYPELWWRLYEIVLNRRKVDPCEEYELITGILRHYESIAIEYEKWQEFANRCEQYFKTIWKKKQK